MLDGCESGMSSSLASSSHHLMDGSTITRNMSVALNFAIFIHSRNLQYLLHRY